MFGSVFEIPIDIPGLIETHNPKYDVVLDRYGRRSQILRGKDKAAREFISIKDPKPNLNKAEPGLKGASFNPARFQRGFSLLNINTPDPSMATRRNIARRLRMSEDRSNPTFTIQTPTPSYASTPQVQGRNARVTQNRISQAIRRPRDAIISPRQQSPGLPPMVLHSTPPQLNSSASDHGSTGTVELIDDSTMSEMVNTQTQLRRMVGRVQIGDSDSPQNDQLMDSALQTPSNQGLSTPVAPPIFDMSIEQDSSSSD